MNGLNWPGIAQWKRTNKQIWSIRGEIKGWAKVSGNLWFVLVNHAGHMVPIDQPEAAFKWWAILFSTIEIGKND